MIITISGNPGSGKSTVAKIVARKLGLKPLSSGDFMRQLAEERGISLLELSRIAETDQFIDQEIDQRTIRFGKEHDDFVMDSRLAFHFIPHSIKVFLEVRPTVAAERIFREKRWSEKENTDVKTTLQKISERQESERKRYQQYYGVDYLDKRQFDLVIDTTQISAEDAAEKIFEFVKKK